MSASINMPLIQFLRQQGVNFPELPSDYVPCPADAKFLRLFDTEILRFDLDSVNLTTGGLADFVRRYLVLSGCRISGCPIKISSSRDFMHGWTACGHDREQGYRVVLIQIDWNETTVQFVKQPLKED